MKPGVSHCHIPSDGYWAVCSAEVGAGAARTTLDMCRLRETPWVRKAAEEGQANARERRAGATMIVVSKRPNSDGDGSARRGAHIT